jgi:hypothetical protein
MVTREPTKTSMTKDTRKRMPPRGKSERNKILDAMKRCGKTEDGFYELLVAKGHDEEDSFTFKELLIRLSPIPKSVNPLYEFPFNEKGSHHEQSLQIVKAIANGKIPSDVGHSIIATISTMLNIQEKTDFEERLKAIEDASKQD